MNSRLTILSLQWGICESVDCRGKAFYEQGVEYETCLEDKRAQGRAGKRCPVGHVASRAAAPSRHGGLSKLVLRSPSPAMLLLPLLALLSLPFSLAAISAESAHEKLVKLAASNNGLIKLDDSLYGLLTHPKRTWSASVHLTAMDPRRRCAPCK